MKMRAETVRDGTKRTQTRDDWIVSAQQSKCDISVKQVNDTYSMAPFFNRGLWPDSMPVDGRGDPRGVADGGWPSAAAAAADREWFFSPCCCSWCSLGVRLLGTEFEEGEVETAVSGSFVAQLPIYRSFVHYTHRASFPDE